MFNIFRKSALEPLAVSMSSVKLGNRLLVVGCRDPRLIAALGAKAGLTGRACAVDDSEQRVTAAMRGAEREGVLIEPTTTALTKLPFEDAAFDVAVVHDALAEMSLESRARALNEVRRVLRPGGRCLVIESTSGLGALFNRSTMKTAYHSSGGAPGALTTAGFVAVRTVAERGGQLFVEGVKKNA